MTNLTTKAIQRDLRASQLEEDSRKLAEAIRASDGNVTGEVESIRKTVMEYRAEVWRKQPPFDLQQRATKQNLILPQQLPSPISEISNDPSGQQVVSSTVTDKEIFGAVDKLVNGKDNEMVQNMLIDFVLKRKAAEGSWERSPEGALHASELHKEALRPRKSVKKLRSAIHERKYSGSDTEIENSSDSSADEANATKMVEASKLAGSDQEFHGFEVLLEALELVAAAETITQLQRGDVRVGKK